MQLKVGSGLRRRQPDALSHSKENQSKIPPFSKEAGLVVRRKNDGKPLFCSLTSGNNTALIHVLQQADSWAFVLWLVSVSDLPPLVVQLSYGRSQALLSSKTLLHF